MLNSKELRKIISSQVYSVAKFYIQFQPHNQLTGEFRNINKAWNKINKYSMDPYNQLQIYELTKENLCIMGKFCSHTKEGLSDKAYELHDMIGSSVGFDNMVVKLETFDPSEDLFFPRKFNVK